MEMSSEDSSVVTLALVDPSLLSSWEGMVKRGVECSLLLKHSKGKIIATLQSTTPSPCPTLSHATSLPSSAEKSKKRKKRKGSKEKRLKDLLAYHQRLVEEKGLPPSRLMEQHAAVSASPNQSPGRKEKLFKCDQCEFSSVSQRGLKVHVGRNHKVQQAAEILRDDEEVDVSLNLSHQNDERDENISSVNAGERSLELCKNCDQEDVIMKTCCESEKQLCEVCCFELKVCKLYSFVGLCIDCDAELRPYSVGCCERTKQLCEDCCDEPHG